MNDQLPHSSAKYPLVGAIGESRVSHVRRKPGVMTPAPLPPGTEPCTSAPPAMKPEASSTERLYSSAMTVRTAGATKPTTTLLESLIAVKTSPRSRL